MVVIFIVRKTFSTFEKCETYLLKLTNFPLKLRVFVEKKNQVVLFSIAQVPKVHKTLIVFRQKQKGRRCPFTS